MKLYLPDEGILDGEINRKVGLAFVGTAGELGELAADLKAEMALAERCPSCGAVLHSEDYVTETRNPSPFENVSETIIVGFACPHCGYEDGEWK